MPLILAMLLVVGCETPSPLQDVERYRKILDAPGDDADAALSACGKIHDPDLAGDCGLFVAQRAAAVAKSPLEPYCDGVARGTWRAECFFLAAEEHRRAGRQQRAAELCVHAGPFIDDCVQHLWQTDVRRLIHAPRQVPDFAGKLNQAQEIYERWSTLLDRETRFGERFWLRYYQNGFESANGIDLAWCAELPELHRKRCEDAAAESLKADLPPRIDRVGEMKIFCDMEHPGAAEASRWMRLTPAPALDAVILERHQALCGAAGQGIAPP